MANQNIFTFIIKLLLTIILLPIAMFYAIKFFSDDPFRFIRDLWTKPNELLKEWNELPKS